MIWYDLIVHVLAGPLSKGWWSTSSKWPKSKCTRKIQKVMCIPRDNDKAEISREWSQSWLLGGWELMETVPSTCLCAAAFSWWSWFFPNFAKGPKNILCWGRLIWSGSLWLHCSYYSSCGSLLHCSLNESLTFLKGNGSWGQKGWWSLPC